MLHEQGASLQWKHWGHAHTHIHAHTHTRTHTNTHTQTHTCTRTRTHTHTHTHTHTNTHTQLMHTEKPPTHLLCCPPRSVYPPLSLSPFLYFSFLLSLSLCYGQE